MNFVHLYWAIVSWIADNLHWPLYSFDIIPIQLISSIYELFSTCQMKMMKRGTYYTPLHLVDMIMDEVYPWEGEYKEISFLIRL